MSLFADQSTIDEDTFIIYFIICECNTILPVINTSVPDNVVQALFQFSNKYPVSIKLLVKANRNAYSLADPMKKN